LTYDFFIIIYNFSYNSDRFSLCLEMFHILNSILDSEDTDKNTFKIFLCEFGENITSFIVKTLESYYEFTETYIVERESLVVRYYHNFSLLKR